jgi:hypothetical protein
MSRRAARVWAITAGVGSILVALVWVRLSLDWSDTQPYQGAVTETRYLVFIAVAAAIVLIGAVVGILLWRKGGRPRS